MIAWVNTAILCTAQHNTENLIFLIDQTGFNQNEHARKSASNDCKTGEFLNLILLDISNSINALEKACQMTAKQQNLKIWYYEYLKFS